MADLNEVKTPSGFNKVTTASDTDMVPVGNTSLNMMTIANLKEVLGINALKLKLQVETYTATKSGNIAANPTVKQSGNVKMLKINTTTALSMTAGTAYTLCYLAANQRPDTDYINYVSQGRLTISASGDVIFSPTATLASGSYLHITETFI